MLQQTDVVCHPIAALGNGRQAVQDPAVQLPGIGLAADGEALFKAEVMADHPVHLVDPGGITVKKIQEAGLGAGGAPAAQELHIVNDKIQFLQIGKQILHPQCCPLAHGHQLRRLIVGIAQGGQGLVGIRKVPEVRNHF